MKKVAFIFPGQGSQSVGMGKALHDQYVEVQEMFETANKVLDQSLTNLMFEGPSDELTNTENAQPALLLTSVAINQLLHNEGVTPVITAGHSLGEYSALVAAGALSFEDAISVVKTRGNLMEKAYPKGKGTMAAVLGLSSEAIEVALTHITEKSPDEVVEIANLNCPGQVVISGTKQAIEDSVELLKEAGAKRVIPLNVSGPFHSKLMKSAAEDFADILANITISNADLPVYANVTAEKVTDKQVIEELLVKQLYSPVRFEEIIHNIMEENVDAIVEVGCGKVLTGLVKKVNRRMTTFTVQDPESLQAFIDWYKEES